MSDRHTPGPWHSEGMFVVDEQHRDIADCYSDGVPQRERGERWANAQLIAAAPDLLAAAEQAHKALLDRVPGSVPGGAAACEALLQAIAKARGAP